MQNIFPSIHTAKELFSYLSNSNNIYTEYIKSKISRPKNLCPIPIEQHHIIPKFAGGCNQKWNLIPLGIEEHTHAHELRAIVYGQLGDILCCRMRKSSDSQKLRLQLSHLSQRKTLKGFWNSEIQRQNGRKGGKRQTAKKKLSYTRKLHPLVATAFCHTMVWKHPSYEHDIIIKPNTFSLVKELALYLNSKVTFDHALTTSTSGLARVIKGERYSFKKWKLTFHIH